MVAAAQREGVQATIGGRVVRLASGAHHRGDRREENHRVEREIDARLLEAPPAVCLGRVDAQERAGRHGGEQPVGEHAGRVPDAAQARLRAAGHGGDGAPQLGDLRAVATGHMKLSTRVGDQRLGRSSGDLAASRSQHHSGRAKPREPLRGDEAEAAGAARDELERPHVVAALGVGILERIGRNSTEARHLDDALLHRELRLVQRVGMAQHRPHGQHRATARGHIAARRQAEVAKRQATRLPPSRAREAAQVHVVRHQPEHRRLGRPANGVHLANHEHTRRLQHGDVMLIGAAAICGRQDDRSNRHAGLQAGGDGIRCAGQGPDAAHGIALEREPKRGVQLGWLGQLGRGRPRELVHMAAPTARLEEAGLEGTHLAAMDLHDELTVAVVDGGKRRFGLGGREVMAPHRGRLPKVGVEHLVRLDGRGKVRPAKHVLGPASRSRDVELRHERARLIARVEPGTASHHLGAVGGAAARKRWRLLAAVHLVEAAPHPRLLDGLKLVLVVVADGRVELVLVRDVGRARDGALDVERDELVGPRLEDADAHLGVDRLGGAFVGVGGNGQHVGPPVESQLLADLGGVVVEKAEGLEHGLVDAERLSLGEGRHDLPHEDDRVVVGAGDRPEVLGHRGVDLFAPQILLARVAHDRHRVDVALDRQELLQDAVRDGAGVAEGADAANGRVLTHRRDPGERRELHVQHDGAHLEGVAQVRVERAQLRIGWRRVA
eukprot:scaffold36275_cov154-Isochrysis_galbana.AAC.11